MSYFKNPAEFGSDDKGLGLGVHLEKLTEVYQEVVRPMCYELKQTMRQNNLLNEAEMFCTDLEFRADQNGRTREFIGDNSKKQDDLVRKIQETISFLTIQFKKKLRQMADNNSNTAENQMRSLSLCVFIATYFRLEVNGHTNEDSVWLYEHASPLEREALQDLWMKKSIDLAE